MNNRLRILGACALLAALPAQADENLFGYVKGAEPLPKGARELYQHVTFREGKSVGHYQAWNLATEFEYGVTDRFATSAYLKMQAIDVEGLLVDGYLPGDKEYGPRLSGTEVSMKYNFLSPAKEPLGLSVYWALDYDWLDPHSGQDKDTLSMELHALTQKYLLDGQLIWVGNAGIETTYAQREPIEDLPPGFEWPTEPEMEVELIFGTGLSYRFAPNWFIGAELSYETEFETEVGQERWSWFGGPTLHYGGQKWWATATWFPQLQGGGEQFDGQDQDLHLIEKTENEYRLKLGFNF